MHYHTIGHMSVRLQRAPGAIEGAIRALQLEPALILNDQRFYDQPAENTIDGHLREQAAERELSRGRAKSDPNVGIGL